MSTSSPNVSVILLAYLEEPLLQECVDAVFSSEGVAVELILVDNGCPRVNEIRPDPRIQVLRPGFNTGFAGGCNRAVDVASHELLVFVNSDLIVSPQAFARLIHHLAHDSVGLVTGAVQLPGHPTLTNAAGNPIHFLMFSWSGSYREPYEQVGHPLDVTGISGALFACTKKHWRALGGFDEEYLAYAEDADISLRTWQSGHRVLYESMATGVHHYEFARRSQKWFLLERNRLINFFTLYDATSTVLLLPAFVIAEIGMFYAASRAGWWRQKIESWRWIAKNGSYLYERRKRIQSKKEPSNEWAKRLRGSIDLPSKFEIHIPTLANRFLDGYWKLVSRWIS
jgi:GT2 family glycosyltransferase